MNVGMMMVFASYGWENCPDARVWDEEIRLARLAADLGFGSVSKVEVAIFTPPVQRHSGSQTSRSRCHASALTLRSRWSCAPSV
jgi:hypothetical protein